MRDAINGQIIKPEAGAGRRAGVPNKIKRVPLLQKCEELGFDPEQSIIEIAQGHLDCLKCFGRGKTFYAKNDPETGEVMIDDAGDKIWEERKCQSCGGTLREKLDVTDVLKARQIILDKIVPSLKQIDHSNDDGSLRPGWTMVFPKVMEAPRPGHGKTPPMLQQKKED